MNARARTARERARSVPALSLRAAREASDLDEDAMVERVHLWYHVTWAIGFDGHDEHLRLGEHGGVCRDVQRGARGTLHRLERMTQGTFERGARIAPFDEYMFLATVAHAEASESEVIAALVEEKRREIREMRELSKQWDRDKAAELAERLLAGRIDGLARDFAEGRYAGTKVLKLACLTVARARSEARRPVPTRKDSE